MKAELNFPGLEDAISAAIEKSLANRITELQSWPYVNKDVAAALLNIKVKTLLDKSKGYLDELEYYQQNKTFWFKKEALLFYVEKRRISKKRPGRIPNAIKSQAP
jgi:hypothetical protein